MARIKPHESFAVARLGVKTGNPTTANNICTILRKGRPTLPDSHPWKSTTPPCLAVIARPSGNILALRVHACTRTKSRKLCLFHASRSALRAFKKQEHPLQLGKFTTYLGSHKLNQVSDRSCDLRTNNTQQLFKEFNIATITVPTQKQIAYDNTHQQPKKKSQSC